MQYRNLGKHGVKVSEVGFGSWMNFNIAPDSNTARSLIERAYDDGINFFDTANGYAGGESEKIIGKTLSKYARESYVVATKLFYPMSPWPNSGGLSRKAVIEQCNASLRRLGLDYVDLLQCHNYDAAMPLEESLGAFDDLARQGKILYMGVSNWNAAQIADAANMIRSSNLRPIVSNQPYYNMLGRGIEDDIIPLCEREGIGQVVFCPLAQGVLTGKYKPGQAPPSDSRAANPDQSKFILNEGNLEYIKLQRVRRLIPIAEEAGLSMPQLALAWCLRQQNVSSVIIGASRPWQIDDNAAASGKVLDADILEKIEEVFAS